MHRILDLFAAPCRERGPGLQARIDACPVPCVKHGAAGKAGENGKRRRPDANQTAGYGRKYPLRSRFRVSAVAVITSSSTAAARAAKQTIAPATDMPHCL